ncbi:MAG: GNAT family protein [Pyrinomonadaceae bacterium]
MFSFQVDEHLKLALPQPYMAEELTVVVRENLERLKPWMPWAVDEYSVESANEFISRSLKSFANDGRLETVILFDGKIIGSLGFHDLDQVNRSAHVGYWISETYERRGIVTRCCRALIDYLFNSMKLNRVQINCNVENLRSRAVPESLGFKLEGTHRQVELLNDRFRDWAVYALLREEWKG